MRLSRFISFTCHKPQQPNGYGCGIILPKKLQNHVQNTWEYLGYSKSILLNCSKPMLIIALYLPHPNFSNTRYSPSDLCNFLLPILKKAKLKNYSIVKGGDFNQFSIYEILYTEHSHSNRTLRHEILSFASRYQQNDIWHC
jgi:Ulp1 family protease